jgi:hypothetical protein
MNGHEVEASHDMQESKFRKMAAESNATSVIQIQVIEVSDGGWAILGPFGIYRAPDRAKVFQDLAQIHALLREWGVRKFLEAGQERVLI